MDLTQKKRERDQLRRVFARHEQTATSQVDFEFLSEKVERIQLLDQEIHQELLTSEHFDEEAFDDECDSCDLYKKKWLVLKAKLNPKPKQEEKDVKEEGKKAHNLNLPRIEIRKFDDNPKSWLAFWGQFKKIHEDSRMDAETKFQYLSQAMTEESKARSLVDSYPPTEENYPKVINTLKERFAKDETLIEIYVRELLKLVNNKHTVTLDLLYDKIVANLQILESLGIIKDKYECILLPMIESALPENVLLSWSKAPYIKGESKLSNLLKFLQTEVEAERRVLLAKSNFLDSSTTTDVVPTAACLVNEAQVKLKSGPAKGQPEKEGNNGEKKVRALLDSGSQRTYVRTGLAQELGLQVTGSENLSHSLFGGVKKATQAHRVFMFQVSDLENSFTTTMTGLEQEELCGNLPRIQDAGLLAKLKSHKIYLTDANENLKTDEIDLLVGSDYLGSIIDGHLVHVTDKLVAVSTKLGWTLQGPIDMSKVYNNIVIANFVTATTVPDENSLEFLWDLETLGIKDPYQKECNDTNYLKISVNGEARYEVSLIWKEDGPQLGTNYEQAQKRLWSTTKKLENMKKLEGYHEVLKDWEKEGVIEVVQNDSTNEGHYLPHHAVIKLESATTKIRPVLDASCKDDNKRSLNSCIEKGPNLIEIIPKLLTLFRARQYGVISDIRKAFLQIAVSPADRKYLKLLWWNHGI